MVEVIEVKIWSLGAKDKIEKVFQGTIDPKNMELQTSGKYVIKVEDKQPMEGVKTCPICGKKIKAKGWAPHKKMHERAREKGQKQQPPT